MKLSNLFSVSAILFVLIATGCQKDSVEILIGTWKLTEAEIQSPTLGNLQSVDASGTIILNEDMTGSLDYQFTAGGFTATSNGPFEWRATDSNLYLDEGTANAITFTREVNEKKKQRLSYTESSTGETLKIILTFEK